MYPKHEYPNKVNGNLLVDCHGQSDGYFFASVKDKTDKKHKLRVANGSKTMTYDLKSDGTFELFPLNFGNGFYQVVLYQNVTGNKYSNSGSVGFFVMLKNENAPYLVPNQYVMYSEDSEAVKIADKISTGLDQSKSFEAVQKYVRNNLSYDFIKAVTRKPGMIPDIEGTIKKRSGICQDLSAVVVAMMRSLNIPSRLVIGYADKQYHAWTETKIEQKWTLYDPTVSLLAMRKPLKYTCERVY